MVRSKPVQGLAGTLGVAIAALAAACGDHPTSPARVAPPAAYVLSGVVTENSATGSVPVEGAVVRVSGAGTATTDSTGSYTVAAVRAGTATVTVTKEGYQDASRVLTLSGDLRVDFVLFERRPPTPTVITGVVYERMADSIVPVAGVHVEESSTHLVSTTDANGRYSIALNGIESQFDGLARLYVAKEGYNTVIWEVAVQGETRVDVEIVRR